MEKKKYEQLQKDVTRLNEEHLIGNQSIKLFANAEEAIQAIRNNEIPGITWGPEEEEKYQRLNYLEDCLDEESSS